MDENKGMELQLVVNPGTAVCNFEELKQAVVQELEEKYMHMEVSDESLKEAREARARLNRVKDSLKAAMRSAQAQNDEPLEIPRKQAKELETLLGTAINTLDVQIKAIEQGRREQRLAEAKGLMAQVIATFPEPVQEIAVKCEWIVQKSWGNATTSASQVKKDTTEACQNIQTALMTFNGDFRPQMLDEFVQSGNLSASLLFGQKLQRQKDAYEEAQRRKKEEEAQAASKVQAEKEEAQEPALKVKELEAEPESYKEPSKQYVFNEPSAKNNEDMLNAFINIKITARRYQIQWILDVMRVAGIPYIRLK